MSVEGDPPLRRFDQYGDVGIKRRRLPHWQQSGVAFFITFRLADSLPQAFVRQWRAERATWLQWHAGPLLAAEQREYQERFFHRIQHLLDAGIGACHLRRPEIRDEIERCLLRFDAERYDIDAFVLMPNHVHLILCPKAEMICRSCCEASKG